MYEYLINIGTGIVLNIFPLIFWKLKLKMNFWSLTGHGTKKKKKKYSPVLSNVLNNSIINNSRSVTVFILSFILNKYFFNEYFFYVEFLVRNTSK